MSHYGPLFSPLLSPVTTIDSDTVCWGAESRLRLTSKPGKVAMELPIDPVSIAGQVQQGLGEVLVTSQELLGTLLCSILFALLSPFFPLSFHLSDDHCRGGWDEC